MHYNKWNSSSIEHRLKQHALQVLKISLTTNTIHVWKCVGLLTGFWIKQKFQDTSLHHTSLTPSAGRWIHYLLLKENITHSLGYVWEAEVKSPFMYKWAGIYSQGWNWPLWLFDYPHDRSTSMTFQLTWLYVQQVGLLDFHITSHWLQQAHSGDVGNMTHDLTRHDLTWQCWYICASARVHVEL